MVRTGLEIRDPSAPLGYASQNDVGVGFVNYVTNSYLVLHPNSMRRLQQVLLFLGSKATMQVEPSLHERLLQEKLWTM